MGEATFGKYRLIAELGHGGMADVFLAVNAGPVGSGFTKLIVVKRLRANLADEPEFVEMLVDEARISARLNHPNVVQTNEVGAVDNQYFLAMEYLDGQPLHRIQHRAMQKAQRESAELSTDPPPGGEPRRSVTRSEHFPKDCQYLVIVDTLAGLHHAHELKDYDGSPLGIVHRDVTPHNVFVTYEGQVKVVDFGIAKAAGRASETRQGVVKGKIRYMAPEQAVGQSVDRRADLFSVGIMLWEAATGRRLWKDMDDLNIVQALVSGNVKVSPREIDPTVPEAIDRICRKALAFRPDDRYATAEEFRAELENYLGESGGLTTARRRLASTVAELFKDKRAEIQGVIEKQLAQLKARSSELQPMTMPRDSGSSSSIFMPMASAGAVSVPITVAGEDAPASVPGAQLGQKRSKSSARGKIAAFVAVSALVIATAAFALNREAWKSSLTKPNPATSGETTSAEIRVRIVTTPPTAQVTIDQAPVPPNAKMPRDTREHVVRVEAPGFDPATETVRFDSDITMTVVLTRPGALPSVSGQPAPSAAPNGQKARWPLPVTSTKAVTAASVAPPTSSSAPPATSSSAPTKPRPILDDIEWGSTPPKRP